MNYMQTVMNPAWYHGRGQRPPFFEGWYYKLVNQDETQRFAIIPGVFIHQSPHKNHSFVQVLNGTTATSNYHQFQRFEAAENAFDVKIGNADGTSHFTAERMVLDIHDDIGSITGELTFKNLKPWPITVLSPGIMGWYGWVPGLETNHGVLSLDHAIEGELTIYGETIDFTGGRGYIEKDWGKAFPDAYIWMQSNHFDTVGTSLTASVSTLRGPLAPPTGFIVGFLHKGTLYRFTTYAQGSIRSLQVDDETVQWRLYNENYDLNITAKRAEGGLLKGPEREDMSKRVDETMMASVEVELIKHKGQETVYKGSGRNLGLEVVGEVERLFKNDNTNQS